VTWDESLTDGPQILGPAVRNSFIRIYWLPRFVHPWCNANPGITLTNSVGCSPWQGWHEKWFRPYLITVCSVSLSISIFRNIFLFFCYSLSLLSCLYVCVSHCWCRHTGRQSCITLPSELYISISFVHGTLHCYFVWLGLFQVIGLPLALKELSNKISKEIYLDSKPKELTG